VIRHLGAIGALCISAFFLIVLETSASITCSPAQTCGQPIASPYRGVAPLSNSPYQAGYNDCAGTGQYGEQYQCVEFVKRFYSQALGVDTSHWHGNALDYYTMSPDSKGLMPFENATTTVPPEPDDILVFDAFGKDTVGHIAIVTAVTSGQIDLIEQNFSCSGTLSLPLSQDAARGTWTVGNRKGQPVKGWLRLKSRQPASAWLQTAGPDLTNSNVTAGLVTTSLGEVFASTSRSCQDSNALGVFRSTDQGASWTPLNLGLLSTNVFSLALSNRGNLFAGAHDGVYRYDRTLATWEPSGLSGQTIVMLVATTNGLFAADSCYCRGLYQSLDEGATWQPTMSGLPGCVNAFVQDVSGNSFAGTGTSGVFKLPSGGSAWQAINSGLPTSDVHGIALDAGGNLYMGGPAGLFRLNQGSTQWQQLTSGLPADGIQRIAFGSAAKVFVGTFSHGIYLSNDGGNSWNVDNSGIANFSPTIGAFVTDSQGYLYTSVGSIVYRSASAVQ